MTTIKQDDFIQSIADALQFISYYHPDDFVKAMAEAWRSEQSPAAKDAIAQILVNSRMCAEGHRPICQDTGMVVAFVDIGMNLRWQADMSVEEMVNEGVRRAYSDPENVLRASMVADPAGARKNTGDNTPAVVHTRMVTGDGLSVRIAAKGGGSENKAKFTVLNPSNSLVDWILDVVPAMGAGWCPPGMLGIGIGGSGEKAMLLAKEALMEHIDINELKARGARTTVEKLRLELFERVNALGIGAQGLGGLTTVLDIKINDFPTHAASLPVAVIPNCAATRHVEFTLDGSGPAQFTPPKLESWPDIPLGDGAGARRVNLDGLTKEDIAQWRPGERVLLSGKLLTGRDAAHKRIQDLLANGKPLPDGVDFHNRFIYYVGPVDPVGDEVVGPAGPTTST
ncbi:MAG: fumarate hydratase, partial [Gammaproteobacteria bacterium]|nr:fumarate hydratase [Gammaproteobacteria bacterium]